MRTYKSIVFSFSFLFVSSCLYSQQDNITALDVLKKTEQAYSKNPYFTFASTYSLYLDYTTKKVYEQYNGIVLKKNGVNYFKIKNTEFISFKDCGIKVNHDQKAILIEKGKTTIGDLQQSPLSVTNYLKGFNSKLIPSSNSDYYICELKPAGKMSQIMLSKVLLHIKKSDYSIARQILFFVERMESKNAKGEYIYTIPRLETTFSPRTKNIRNDDLLLKKENYFTEKDKKIVLSKKLSAYKLFKS